LAEMLSGKPLFPGKDCTYIVLVFTKFWAIQLT
jgi:hypothetical protein